MPAKGDRLPFDWNLLDSIAILDGQVHYIAERMLAGENKDINIKSIKSKVKLIERRLRERFDCTYVEYCNQKKETWRLTLKQKMRKLAMDGNVTMCIFLSKQDLNYSDKVEHAYDSPLPDKPASDL